MDKNLTKLAGLLKIIDEGVTKEDFVKSIEAIIAIVIKIQKQQSEAIGNLEATYSELLKRIQNDHSLTLSDIKKQVNSVFVENKLSEIESSLTKTIQDKLSTVKDGERGAQGPQGRAGIDGRNGKDGSADTPRDIVEKLQSLTGDKRLDKSAIKGLDETIKVLTEGGVRMVGGAGRNRIHYHDLSSLLDGNTKTFAVPSNFGVVGVWSSAFPGPFRPTIDYTEGNKTITFTSQIDASVSLMTGQTLVIQYIK